MYDFELTNNEEVIAVFDHIWIYQENNEKNTTIAVTNKRILFMDYNQFDYKEVLRIGRNLDYIRQKEIYYQIKIEDICSIEKKEKYIVFLSNHTNFEFDDDNLFQLLKKILN